MTYFYDSLLFEKKYAVSQKTYSRLEWIAYVFSKVPENMYVSFIAYILYLHSTSMPSIAQGILKCWVFQKPK